MPDPAPPRAWQLVLERIESDLRDGRIAAGDRLPAERDLATQLGVGRSSVREALRVLEVLGLIRTASGSGPSAGAVVVAAPRGGLSALLRLQVAASGFPVEDVVSTRIVLETAAVAALADVREPELADVRRLLDAMDAEDLSTEEFLSLDARLHVALAEASGNVVVAAMMEGLRTAISSYVLASATALADWDATAQRLRAEHRALVDAVAAHDAPRAQRAVREHIARYYEEAGLTTQGANAW